MYSLNNNRRKQEKRGREEPRMARPTPHVELNKDMLCKPSID